MNLTFFKHKILWVPVVIALSIFLIDKLAATKMVRKYTETRIEYSFYEQKRGLLRQLIKEQKQRKPEQKLLILFGTSHFGEFSGQYIQGKFPNLDTYNFSAPMASPSFLYYYFEKVLEKRIQVDYIILEAIPGILQDKANRYAIKFSYDWQFMRKYYKQFSMYELEAFMSANLFASMRFPVRFATIYNRIKNPVATLQLSYMQKLVNLATERNNGGIPNPIIHKVDESTLPQESEIFFNKTLAGYRESPTQRYFFNRFIQKCHENKIRILLLRPLVSAPLEKKIRQTEFYPSWRSRTLKQAQKYNVPFLELEQYRQNIQCQKFVDVHHLSGGCYPEITNIVLRHLLP